MDDVYTCFPFRRIGLIFHFIAIVSLVLLGAFSFWQAGRAQAGPSFLFWLLLSLSFFAPVPELFYRGYALWTAYYILERDGIRLRWGFRLETVPIDAILWVRMSQDYPAHLPRPWLTWPGAVVGTRHLPDGQIVEYMASRRRRLVLIATPGRIFAISPADPESFLTTFRQFSEMGSLTPLSARSVRPSALITEIWSDLRARYLLLGSIFLALILLIWVAAAIPSRSQISLRLSPLGLPGEPIPAIQLLLLPVINAFFCLTDIFAGLFFFRRPEIRPLAYLLWSASSLTALLFIGAVSFILHIP